MTLDPEQLERRVRSARELAGYDQTKIGLLMKADGLGKHDVSKWERQDPTAPPMSPARAQSLALHTGVPVAWFFEPDVGKLFHSEGVEMTDVLRTIREQLRDPASSALDELIDQLDPTSPPAPEEPEEGPGE